MEFTMLPLPIARRRRRARLRCVLAGATLMLSAMSHAVPVSAQAQFFTLANGGSNLALVIQQNEVGLLPLDVGRFAQHWERVDVRSDGTFLLRNRGAVNACLSANPITPDISTVSIVGCAGTNEPSKRWRRSSLDQGGREIRSVATAQFLALFNLCIPGLINNNTCPALKGVALLSDSLGVAADRWRFEFL